MADRSTQAPLFVDALALAQWLMAHFETPGSPLDAQLVALGLELLQVLTLALKNRCRDERIEEADELLVRLRVRIPRHRERCFRFIVNADSGGT